MGNSTGKIVSGPEITKKSGPGGSEIWGPYKKIYTTGIFGSKIFTYPTTIDNVKILCRCRDIQDYIRNNKIARIRILSGETVPACWEDNEIPLISSGDDTYEIHYKDPNFTKFSISEKGVVGLVENLSTSKNQSTLIGIPWQAFALGYTAKQMIKGGKKKYRRYTRKRKL
jgi:hypothetical protein